MKSILRICGFVIIVLIVQIHGNLIAQTVDEGIALIQQKKFSEAKSVFEQILDRDENNAEAHYRLGLVYFNRTNPQRDVDKAVDELEKAVDLKPDSANYQFRYGVALGEKTQKAGIIKQAFLAPKVKNAFKRTVELNPQHAQARIALAQFYLIAPSIVGGDEEEGWKQLDEAIKLDEVPGRSVKASMLSRAKKNDEAEKEYKILVVSKPKDWRTWKNYGYFCMNAERYDDAVGNFKKYIELCPDTADSYQSLAEALLKKGDTEKAMENLNKSLSIDKEYIPAIISLGEVYQAKGQKKEAKETYQRAISLTQNEYYRDWAEKKLKEIE
ncbi:MAG: tetratricopeptide repeat protein [Bacteroidota bacterium]